MLSLLSVDTRAGILDGIDGLHLVHVNGYLQRHGTFGGEPQSIAEQMGQRTHSLDKIGGEHRSSSYGVNLLLELEIADLVDA